MHDADEDRARHFLTMEIAGMWQHGGYAGADVVTANDGRLPLHAVNIGDHIERPSRQDAYLQTQIGSSGACIGRAVPWPAANALRNRTAGTAKNLLVMGIAYGQIPIDWHRVTQKCGNSASDARDPQGTLPAARVVVCTVAS
jgi:hypothetical protein